MRPGEFWEAMNAHSTQVLEQRIHLGNLVRGATIRLWNLQVAKKYRIDDVRKFWPMPWDEPLDDDSEIKRLAGLSEEETQKEVEKFFSKVKKGKANGKIQ